MAEIIVMYWLVALMTWAFIPYDMNKGPSTIPPAMPVHPQSIAAIMHTAATLRASQDDSN